MTLCKLYCYKVCCPDIWITTYVCTLYIHGGRSEFLPHLYLVQPCGEHYTCVDSVFGGHSQQPVLGCGDIQQGEQRLPLLPLGLGPGG